MNQNKLDKRPKAKKSLLKKIISILVVFFMLFSIFAPAAVLASEVGAEEVLDVNQNVFVTEEYSNDEVIREKTENGEYAGYEYGNNEYEGYGYKYEPEEEQEVPMLKGDDYTQGYITPVPLGSIRVDFDLAGGTWEANVGFPGYAYLAEGTPIADITSTMLGSAWEAPAGSGASFGGWTAPGGATVITETITLTATWNVAVVFSSSIYLPGSPVNLTIPLNSSLEDNGITIPGAPANRPGHTFLGWFDQAYPGEIVDTPPGPGQRFTENTTVTEVRVLFPRWTEASIEFSTMLVRLNITGGVQAGGVNAPPRRAHYYFAISEDGTIRSLSASAGSPYYLNRVVNGNPASPQLRTHNLMEGPNSRHQGLDPNSLTTSAQPNNIAWEEWFTLPNGQGYAPFRVPAAPNNATLNTLFEDWAVYDPVSGMYIVELYANWMHRVHFHENPRPTQPGSGAFYNYNQVSIRVADAGGNVANHAMMPINPGTHNGIDLLTMPSDPVVEGRTFLGWYTVPFLRVDGVDWINEQPQIPNPYGAGTIDHPFILNTVAPNAILIANGVDPSNPVPVIFDENSPIHNSMIVFAAWEVHSTTEITFEANGGTFQDGATSMVRVPNPISLRLSWSEPEYRTIHRTPPIPSKPGYVFMGWFPTQNVTGHTINDGLLDDMWIWHTQYTADATYYARWVPAVIVNLWHDAPTGVNDVDAGSTPGAVRYIAAGYTFRQQIQIMSRSTGVNGTANVFRNSDHVHTNLTPGVTGGTRVGFHRITDFDRHRGSNIAGIAAGTATTSASTGIFTTERDAHGDLFHVDTVVSGPGPIDLYSAWASRITFNNNQTSFGGSVNTISGESWATVNSSFADNRIQPFRVMRPNPTAGSLVSVSGSYVFLSSQNPNFIQSPNINPVGQVFVGWNFAADGSGESFTENTNIFGNQTIYAIWSDGLVFDVGLAGDEVVWGEDRVREGLVLGQSVPNFPALGGPLAPVWPGNGFRGWNTQANGQGDWVNNSHTFIEPLTLYAMWSGNLMFDPNGGVLNNPMADANRVVPYLELPLLNFPGNPSRTDWHFVEWNRNANGTGAVFGSTIPVGSSGTVFAQWEGEISFNTNGGSTHDPMRVREDANFGTLPTPTRDGYDFLRWELPNGNEATAETLMTMGNVELTAIFRSIVTVTYVHAAAGAGPDNPPALPTPATSNHQVGTTVDVAANLANVNVTDASNAITGRWTFTGWTASGGITGLRAGGSEFEMPTSSVTLAATWRLDNAFTVSYAHPASSPGQVPAAADMPSLPNPHTGLFAGDSIDALGVTPTTVTIASGSGAGVYTFLGWEASGAVTGNRAVGAAVTIPDGSNAGNVVLTSTWSFEAATFDILYEFVSGTAERPNLPQEVLDLLPSNELAQAVGTSRTPDAPAQTTITVSDGAWTWGGWNPTIATITDANITFTGTWTFAELEHTVIFLYGAATSTVTNMPYNREVADGNTVVSAGAVTNPVATGYTFLGWEQTIPDPAAAGVLASVDVKEITVTQDKKFTAQWQRQGSGSGNRPGGGGNGGDTTPEPEITKIPDRVTVNVGEIINWTLRGFHNPTDNAVTNFAIVDMPSVGLNFQSGSIPAFHNGAGITYDIRYRVAGSNEWHTYISGVDASRPFNFTLSQTGDVHYTAIELFFGNVPADFGRGNEIVFTFRVTDEVRGNTLINELLIRYDNVELEGYGYVNLGVLFSPIHEAYLVGFPDGTIRPNSSITRAEVATIFFRLLEDDYRAQIWSQQNSFNDVAATNWFNNAVSTLTNADIVEGFPDGTFRGNQAITRAEFVTIIARFISEPAHTGSDRFNDISEHWARESINAVGHYDWIRGFAGGEFRPNQSISRAETAAIINRMLERQPESTADLLPGMVVWSDNMNQNAWFYLYIQEATNAHDHEMKADGIHERWIELREPRDWTVLERPNSRPQDIR